MDRNELQRFVTDAVTAAVPAVLATQLEPIRDQMAALSCIPTASSGTRDAKLQAAARQHRDHIQRIDAERETIRNST
jgi:hypothetical protein